MLLRTPKDVGAIIRQRRREMHLDQQTLADRLGVGRKWVVEAEAGKPTMELRLVLRALDTLGIRLSTEEPKKSRTRASVITPDIDAVVEAARKR